MCVLSIILTQKKGILIYGIKIYLVDVFTLKGWKDWGEQLNELNKNQVLVNAFPPKELQGHQTTSDFTFLSQITYITSF